MLTRFILLLLLPVHCLLGSIFENKDQLWQEGPVPEWVVPVDFPKNAEEKATHLQFLLFDLQDYFPEKMEYFHVVAKILSQTGVEVIGQFEIDFDPAFQKLTVHQIKVLRDGIWIDKMSSRSELLQREEGLENRLFDGGLTVVYFLEDIRPGDIVEYSYSRMGSNPLFSSHYFNQMNFQGSFALNKISHRLLTSPGHVFTIKQFNTTIEPTVRDISDSLREWTWVAIDPQVSLDEEFQPEWFRPNAYIEVSDFRNWGEVAALITPLFSLPDELEDSIPEEMVELVKSWKGEPVERALAALRFVQDEVRYLGFEEGIMGHKPHDPLLVFQHRFGDCKDKTFLLHTFLQLMGISSTPVLVGASEGKALCERLPNPNAFNHIILRITIEAVEYWVDSTMSLQGGSLKNNFFPNYYWGLPLTKQTDSLVPLPLCSLEKPTQIDTLVTVISEEFAEMSTVWHAYGPKADSYRQYVQQVGLTTLSEESLNALQKRYGNVSLSSPMYTMDDRENNIFTLTESYLLPLRKKGGHSRLSVSSIVIGRFLDSYFNPTRQTPYSIIYPLWVKEHIHIDNPLGDWDEGEEEENLELSFLFYRFRATIDGQEADFYHELKHLDDHVPVFDVQKYWDAAQNIEENGSFDFLIN
jgi:hypothetical protein